MPRKNIQLLSYVKPLHKAIKIENNMQNTIVHSPFLLTYTVGTKNNHNIFHKKNVCTADSLRLLCIKITTDCKSVNSSNVQAAGAQSIRKCGSSN